MAEQTLASLSVQITAQGEQFTAALKSVESRLGGFEKSTAASIARIQSKFDGFRNTIGTLQGAFAALGSAAALGGLSSLAKKALEAGDDIADLSKRLNLTSDALQSFQFLFQQSGSSAEAFAAGFQTLTKNAGDAAAGIGKARAVFQGLGIDAKQFAQDLAADPTKALAAFADKVSGLQNPAQQAAVALRLVGDESWVSVLREGGTAFSTAGEKAQSAGVIIRNDLVAAAGELNDQFDAATKAINTQFQQALIQISPLLLKAAESTATLTVKLGDLISTVFQLNATGIKGRLTEIAQEAISIQQRIGALEKDLATPSGGIKKFLGFDELEKGAQGLEIEKLRLRMADLTKESEALQSRLDDLGKTHEETGKAATGQAGEFLKLGKATKEVKTEAEKLAERQAKETQELTTKIGLYQQVVAGTISLADAEEELKIQQLAAQTGSRALAESYVKLETNAKSTVEAEKQLTEAVARQVEKMQSVDKAILDAQQGFDDSIGSIDAQKAAFDKVIAAGGNYETAMKEAEVAAARFNATQQAIASGAGSEAARMLADQAEEATRAAQGWDTYTDSVRAASEAGVNITEIIKEGIRGLASGTLNLKDFLKKQGEALGVSLVEGILFGKARKEKGILVNFNQLLGIDAAGIFGSQGLNLGNGLIDGILSSVGSGGKSLLGSLGIDVGSLFGSSAASAAGESWQIGFESDFGILSGSQGVLSTQAANAGAGLGSIFGAAGGYAAAIYFAAGLGQGINKSLGVQPFFKGNDFFSDLLNKGTIAQSFEVWVADELGLIKGKSSRLASQIGSVVLPILGTLLGAVLFAHTPTKGTQIRKGLVEFFEEIEASFADELSSKKYFFKETKDLAKAMFGGDFLAASKQILTDKAGPELAKQLQALGTFLTADQAIDLGKPVEQTGTTFGNFLIANLGIDRIPDAIKETIAKADIGFEDIVTKLNTLFEDSNISEEFYRDAIFGAVDIFDDDLPKAINTSAIALKSFTDDGIFSLSEFEKRVTEATGAFDVIGQAFVDAVRNSGSGEEAARIFGEGLERGLADLALNRFLQDFIDNKLFEGIDLSDGLSDQEKTTLKQRAADARQEADALVDTLRDIDEEADSATESVNRFADALDRINAPFANIGQNLGSTVDSFFDKRASLTSKEAYDRALDANVAAARAGNAGTPGNRTPNALKQLQKDLASIGTVGESIGEQIGQDIGDAFKQAMIDTLINEAIIGPILEPFQAKMKTATEEALSDGILTADEQANLANLAAQASAAGQAAAKGLTPAIEGIENASENIAKGSETAADNFKDIVFPTETKDILTDFGGVLGKAAEALGSVALSGEAANAEDIATDLDAAAKDISETKLPPSLPIDVATISTALIGAATALKTAHLPDALTDVNSIVLAISDAIRKLNDANLTIDVALKNTGVQQFAGGGIVQGPAGRDRVPAMLTAGERVLSLQETATYEKLMEALTGMQVAHFAEGGVAGFNNLAWRTAIDIGNETGARASKREVGKRIWEGIADGISAFLDTGAGAETLESKIASVKAEFEQLSSTLEQQRKYLTKAGVDVDDYLTKLSDGVAEKIRKLVEEANQVVVDAAAGIRTDITSLLLGGDSPLSATQKLSAAQAQESLLRSQLGAATTPEERASLAQQISQSIQQQIGLSPFDRFGQDFQEFFQSSLIRLQDLSSYLTGTVQAAPQGVQVVGGNQEVKIEIVLPPGSTDSDESVRRVKRELLPEMEVVVYNAMKSARGRGIITQTAGPR